MDGFVPRYRVFAFGAIALIIIGLGLALLAPFLPAILWATTFSILMYPAYVRWQKRVSKNKLIESKGLVASAASLMTTLQTFVVIFIPIVAIGASLYLQVHKMVDTIDPTAQTKEKFSIESVLRNADVSLQPIVSQLGAADFKVSEWYAENKDELVRNLRAPVTKGVGNALTMIVTLVIALLTMFFMLRDAENLREPAHRLIPLPAKRTDEILGRVAETVRAVFVGTVLVAIIQGAIIGVAYYFAGVPNSLILAIFSVFLCIIPLLGAPILYIPVGLIMLAQGNTQGAAIILGTGFLIVSQIDNVLKPFFIGGRANLHPMAIFFAVLGGVLLIGPVGVMAGPMVLTVLIAVIEVIREQISAHDDDTPALAVREVEA